MIVVADEMDIIKLGRLKFVPDDTNDTAEYQFEKVMEHAQVSF